MLASSESFCKAFFTRAVRNSSSFSIVRSGAPTGYTTLAAGWTLFDPTVCATGVKLHNCMTGMPIRSISLAITAPQRVDEPQVDVRITASTPSSRILLAISAPMRLELAADVIRPVVAK